MRTLLFVFLVTLLHSQPLPAQEREGDDLTKEERQARLEFMKAKAAEFKLSADKDEDQPF